MGRVPQQQQLGKLELLFEGIKTCRGRVSAGMHIERAESEKDGYECVVSELAMIIPHMRWGIERQVGKFDIVSLIRKKLIYLSSFTRNI